jgi:hypothetical protein
MAKTGFYSASMKQTFCDELATRYGTQVSRTDVLKFATEKGFPPPYWFVNDKSRSIGRGLFRTDSSSAGAPVELTPELFSSNTVQPEAQVALAATVTPIRRNMESMQGAGENLVPERDNTYVEFGDFDKVEKIIRSKIFYPVFITGLSGNGKTLSVEQACAKLGREMIRVNITEETDEDDLVGGYTLMEGNIVYREGPVLTAMRRGAVLILDEVDLNATKIMCLQSIMEGKPYHIKKTGEKVFPAVGFNIFATANTKGKGSEDGRFIGTKVMNEAFLERFPITFEQNYPPEKVELKIILKNMTKFGCMDEKFAANLVKWAGVIRKSFEDGATNEVISTRRLVHIISAFAIFRDRLTAVQICLNRFDTETKNSFFDLYTKVDGEVDPTKKDEPKAEPVVVDDRDNDIPF